MEKEETKNKKETSKTNPKKEVKSKETTQKTNSNKKQNTAKKNNNNAKNTKQAKPKTEKESSKKVEEVKTIKKVEKPEEKIEAVKEEIIKEEKPKENIEPEKKVPMVKPQAEKASISFNLTEMLIIIIIISILVSLASGYLVYKNYNIINKNTSIKMDSGDEKLNEFIDIYEEVKDKYYQEIEESDLIDNAINGMLKYLDKYTGYLSKADTDELQTRLDGEYKGLGVEITMLTADEITIATVFDDSPAARAGLKVGDVLLKVNNTSLSGMTTSDVASMIKGSSASKIKITYKRDNEEKEVEVILKNVIIPSATFELKEDKIGYIGITAFSAKTYSQVESTLEEAKNKNIESLIIDLRDNTGGYLSAAKDISDLFLEKGKIIYKIQYKDGTIKDYKATRSTHTDYKIAVIINGASASASEILASALKESYGATLIGTTSYGKGTMQDTETLSSGAMIKYTSGLWLTPNGNSVNEVGITPDIVIEDSLEGDPQLEAALNYLKNN